ncbi:cobalt-precorrin-6A reductase [Amycolatopsis sp. MtRt-6]|uniref:cobalt-precorrin-6A reductase n=1 Tax=Amycolatopsis sp. MtRt-6 TaxID=2792782 RepID=UPI001A8C1940|nr:cobalt-precorrin-6A reductase [Amycolatopsis sp. MtRt-6]
MDVRPVVLILGGTTEARELATELHAGGDVRVVTSLAGVVRAPAKPAGDLRIGGFGGPEGLADWLVAHAVTAVVDATHPFAATISANAVSACRREDVPLIRLVRPGWVPDDGDRWHRVGSGQAAAALLPGLGDRVFLSTGGYQLTEFTRLDLWFLLRSIEPPRMPLPPRSEVVLARGPFSLDEERALLRRHRIDVLVTKDAGGPRPAAKLTAARELGLPVVMIDRPALPAAAEAGDVASAVRAVREVTG